MSLALNTKHLSSFINEEEYKAIYPQVEAAHTTLEAKNGPGSDFLGWMYLPRDYDKEEFARIKEAAAKIREDSDVLVVAGIGGSYLGARAVIEHPALPRFPEWKKAFPRPVFPPGASLPSAPQPPAPGSLSLRFLIPVLWLPLSAVGLAHKQKLSWRWRKRCLPPPQAPLPSG